MTVNVPVRIGLVAAALIAGPADAATSYHITRATTCTTYADAGDTRRGAGLVYDQFGQLSSLRADFNTPVHGYCRIELPDGTTIRALTAYGEDSSVGEIWFELRRGETAQGTHEVLASKGSTNGMAAWSTMLSEVVDNQGYDYYIYFWISPAPDVSKLRWWNVELFTEKPSGG